MGKKVIKTKRIYQKPEKSDGLRILVDRLWPRGVSKKKPEAKKHNNAQALKEFSSL